MNKTKSRPVRRNPAPKNSTPKSGWGNVVFFFVVAAFTAASVTYFSGGFKLPFSVAFSGSDVDVAGGAGDVAVVPPVSTNGLTTYRDDGTPYLEGRLSDGWVVEPLAEIRANVGPITLSTGSPLQFVTPAYHIVPDNVNAGAYVLEPTADGVSLSELLNEFDKSIEKTTNDAKTILSSLEKLEKLLIEANLPSDEASKEKVPDLINNEIKSP